MVGQVQVQDAELVHTTEELTEAIHHILTQEVLLGTEVILGATVTHTVTQDQIVAGILGPGNKLNQALLRELS